MKPWHSLVAMAAAAGMWILAETSVPLAIAILTYGLVNIYFSVSIALRQRDAERDQLVRRLDKAGVEDLD